MGPNKLHDDLNAQGFKVSREEAKSLYYRYVDKFKTAVFFLRNAGKEAAERGYLTNLNGRRRWWKIPRSGDVDVATYKARMAAIEREGGNFLIQSVNADITKEAMCRLRRYRKENNIKTRFINAVYDEIVTRTNKSQSESFHKEKLRIMREAGEKWITTVPMIVDGAVGPHWKK
jgi:DNA polymerase I-like protein with 3'-5' exonuclease and polymerase domains